MWRKDSVTYVTEHLTPSTASSNQVSGPLYSHTEYTSSRPSRNIVDDSNTSHSLRYTNQYNAKPHYYLPQRSKPNLDNPNAFVGQMMKETFIQVVADLLDKRAEYNKNYVNLPTYSEPESVFFSVSRPDIPTKEYIARLVTYTQCSPSAFVVMLIYLDRIAISNSRLHVTPFNMHRLLVTALTLACKVLDDRCFSNVHYAKVGGIPTAREMNRLELQFLSYVKYSLHVPDSIYHDKLRSLESHSPSPPPLRVPALYTGAPPTNLVDPMMARASPVTPGLSIPQSPRSKSTSFEYSTSTVSTNVGSQRKESFLESDYARNSTFHPRCPNNDTYETLSQDSSCSHESRWTNSRTKVPQLYSKRPRPKAGPIFYAA